MAYVWTDPTVTADTTLAREIHRRELCDNVNAEIVRRGGAAIVWTNTPGVPAVNVLKWTKTDLDQLRAACAASKAACSYDATPAPVWVADPSITADVTLVRKPHIDELRAYIDTENGIGCPSNCPHCTPCSHCGSNCGHCTSHCGCHCWVAREIFGSWTHPKTNAVRFYISQVGPAWFKKLYYSKGEAFASYISDKPVIRAALRPLFELMALLGRAESSSRLGVA